MKIKATICIPTTRTSSSLQKCLDALEMQSQIHFKVLLITKKPISPSLDYTFPIKTVIQKRPGLVGAMNDALDDVNTEIIIRIDDDVVVQPHWYENIIQNFDNPKVGGATGPTLIPQDQLEARDLLRIVTNMESLNNPIYRLLKKIYLDYLYEGRMYDIGRFLKSGVFTLGSNFIESTQLKHSIEVDYAEACNAAFRTHLLRIIGGFDECFTQGLGDYHESDVSYKIRKRGYKIVFNPKAVIEHNIGFGTDKSRGDAANRIRNFIVFYKRHIGVDSLDTACRFGSNIALQNCYYLYKFLTTGKIDNLYAPIGTVAGLISK